MSVSLWIIFNWVFVGIMVGVNVFIFMKLKSASEQMLKMAFPNAKNMNEAMGQMQKMMGGRMPSMGGMGGGGGIVGGLGSLGQPKPKASDVQIKKAVALLQKGKGKK